MAIIRKVENWVDQYTAVPNHWARDKSLSLKARGLLLELLSHSVGWSTTVDLLRSERDGRDSVKSAVAELESAGWLVREQARGDGGLFAETDWVLVEPCRSEPVAGFPSTVKPSTDNPLHKKNNSLEDQNKELSRPSSDARPTALPDDWVPTDKHRAKARKLGISDSLFEQTVIDMRRWAFAKDIRRKSWNQTFNSFLAKVRPDVATAEDLLAELEPLVAEGRVSEVSKALGVKVVVPDFGDIGPQETLVRRREWLKSWWETEGRSLAAAR